MSILCLPHDTNPVVESIGLTLEDVSGIRAFVSSNLSLPMA